MWSSVLMPAFFALSLITGATASYLQMPDGIEKDQIIYEKYLELDQDIKKAVGSGIKMVLPFVMEANGNLNLSTSCSSNLFQLFSGIKKLQLDAVKFLDASGKPPAGFMTGTFHMLGDYDECLNTSILRKDGIVAFKGQYCMLEVRPILPKRKGVIKFDTSLQELLDYAKNVSETFKYMLSTVHIFYENPSKYGMCVPSGCSLKDMNMMLHYLAERSLINATAAYCDTQDEKPLFTIMIVAICALSVIGVLTVAGSLLDYYSMKKKEAFRNAIARTLVCFSVFTNFPKLISTKISDNVLSCLCGIRSLSLFYVIFLHQVLAETLAQSNGHLLSYKEEMVKFFNQIVINGFLTVETFFFVGGLVNSYARIKYQQSGKRQPSVLQIIIHRLWRIYPAYIFATLIFFLFLNISGPMTTPFRNVFIMNCETEWWKNALFINNFFHGLDICMPQGWYIAADMQLFFVSLFTVPVLLKSAKKGVILHIGVIAIGLTATALWAGHKDITPAIIVNRLDRDGLLKLTSVYSTVLPHLAPYFTGVIFGYILSSWKDLKISTTAQVIGWPVAAACLISMLFMPYKWNLGAEYTRIESALYFSFSRFLFVLPVGWLVLCCCRGYGGILNYILSLKIWIPITRLAYMMFLLSPLLQVQFHARSKMLIDTDIMSRIWRYIGDLGATGLLCLVVVVLMESPFISLEKILFHGMSTAVKEDARDNVKVQTKINEDELSKEMELQNNLKNISIKL